VGLGQGGQLGDGVDAEEEGAGLVVHVQDLRVHFHVAVEVAAEVAVEGMGGSPWGTTKCTKNTKKEEHVPSRVIAVQAA
jgi:hypothetical protein